MIYVNWHEVADAFSATHIIILVSGYIAVRGIVKVLKVIGKVCKGWLLTTDHAAIAYMHSRHGHTEEIMVCEQGNCYLLKRPDQFQSQAH